MQGYYPKGRGEKAAQAGDEAAAQQYHKQALAIHTEAKGMREAVLGKRHLEVAVSLQQAAISMAVGHVHCSLTG